MHCKYLSMQSVHLGEVSWRAFERGIANQNFRFCDNLNISIGSKQDHSKVKRLCKKPPK